MIRYVFMILIGLLFPLVVSAQQAPVVELAARLGRGPAECVAWSPTDDVLAVAGDTGIRLYTGELQDIASLERDLSQPCLEWSPDGQYLVVTDPGYETPFTAIYDVTGDTFQPVLDDIADKRRVAWSPDGAWLIVQTATDVHVLNHDTLEQHAQFEGVVAVDFSGDSHRLAVIHADRITVVDIESKNVVANLYDDEMGLIRAVWSPQNDKIAGVSKDRVLVWDVNSGEHIGTRISEVENEWTEISPEPYIREIVGSILWSNDNDTLLVVNKIPIVGVKSTLRVWHIAEDAVISEQPVWLVCALIDWSPNFGYLLFRGTGGSLYPYTKVFDVDGWRELESNNFNDGDWALSPDRHFLLSSTFRSDVIRLLDANNLEIVRDFDTQANRPNDIAWDRDGTKFASAHRDEIQVWDVDTGQRIAQRVDHIESYWNSDLAWSPDGHAIAFSGNMFGLRHTYNQGNLRVWDVTHRQPILSIPGHAEFLRDIVWSSDGSQILTSTPYSVNLWDAATGDLLYTFLEDDNAPIYSGADWNTTTNQIAVLQSLEPGQRGIGIFDADTGSLIHEFNVTESTVGIAWRPKSAMLLVINQADWAIVDVDTGDTLLQIPHEEDFLSRTAWSPDGSLLVTVTLNSHIAMWEIADDGTQATRLWEMTLNDDEVAFALTWHPDGHVLAVGKNQEVLILDARTGEIITQFETPSDPHISSQRVNSLAWSPDGRQIASFTEFVPYLYLWQVPQDF